MNLFLQTFHKFILKQITNRFKNKFFIQDFICISSKFILK